MVKFRVITDSSCGISQQDAKKLGVVVLPLTLSYKGKDYLDGIDITTDEFYKMVFEEEKKEGLLQQVKSHFNVNNPIKTSMVTPVAFENAMKDVIKDGYIPVVLPISSVLSGTYNSALIAKDSLENEEIYVEDSHTALGSVKVMILRLISHEYETIKDVLDYFFSGKYTLSKDDFHLILVLHYYFHFRSFYYRLLSLKLCYIL